MRFLHLSDLHLGKRVCEFSMLDDQRYILEQILSLLDKTPVDGVLLAGDLYDKPVPPAEAVRLLDWFLTQLAERRLPVFAISGNHDSADRIAFGAALLQSSRVYVSPVFSGAPVPSPSLTNMARWTCTFCSSSPPWCGMSGRTSLWRATTMPLPACCATARWTRPTAASGGPPVRSRCRLL